MEKAINIAQNCALAYKKAKPETRQVFNQAFFKKVFVKDKKIEGVKYTDLFGALLSKSSSKKELVGVPGFEPGTSSLSEMRSNQLSYTPAIRAKAACKFSTTAPFACKAAGRRRELVRKPAFGE